MVLSVTRCGAWISNYGEKRFVLDNARKKFAAKTKRVALESFIARKKRQAAIYSSRCRAAEDVLQAAKNFNCENEARAAISKYTLFTRMH